MKTEKLFSDWPRACAGIGNLLIAMLSTACQAPDVAVVATGDSTNAASPTARNTASTTAPTSSSTSPQTAASVSASSSVAASSSAATAATTSNSARAARIIFRNTYPFGSFDAAAAAGTAAVPGSGLPATRLFNPDGSPLATNGPTGANWPAWVSSIEIGVSGSANGSAQNADCARFAKSREDTDTLCDFNLDGTAETACGAAAGIFRVSEYDCAKGAAANGIGGPNDGVYVRVVLDRSTDKLAANENLLAVLEYAASGLNAAPAAPTACFTGGTFNAANPGCGDMNWQIYLKHNAYEVVQPFLMLVPPTLASVNTTLGTGGSGVSTRQFILPLAGDADLRVLQLSRIRGLPISSPHFGDVCNTNGPTSANSALCVGMILYSLTLYRM